MIGHKVTQFASLDSTNNYVAKRLMSGLYESEEVILAHCQTQGRGSRGRFWQSNPGENLTFSFAIDTDFLSTYQNFIVSKAVSVAIFDFLSNLLNAEIRIKWPNDILVSGKKICGILIENKLIESHQKTIVGIGLNVNQTQFVQGVKATSMALELGYKLKMNGLLDQLLLTVNTSFNTIFDRFFEPIDRKYMTHLYGVNQWIVFKEKAKEVTGQIREVDHQGVLLVRSKQGRAINYRFNEVKIKY